MAIEIPGLREAVARERFIRDTSFLDLTKRIGRFEVKQMTLGHYVTLSTLRNPLIAMQVPDDYELAYFLWLLSPEWRPGSDPKRFYKRCWFLKPARPPLIRSLIPFAKRKHERRKEELAQTISAAILFVCDSFCDCPSSAGPEKPQYYSTAAAWIDLIAREYGWSARDILDTPMRCLFQYHKAIIKHNSNDPLCNPSDACKDRWLVEQDAKIRRN